VVEVVEIPVAMVRVIRGKRAPDALRIAGVAMASVIGGRVKRRCGVPATARCPVGITSVTGGRGKGRRIVLRTAVVATVSAIGSWGRIGRNARKTVAMTPVAMATAKGVWRIPGSAPKIVSAGTKRAMTRRIDTAVPGTVAAGMEYVRQSTVRAGRHAGRTAKSKIPVGMGYVILRKITDPARRIATVVMVFVG
jgi:hypothetical protein